MHNLNENEKAKSVLYVEKTLKTSLRTEYLHFIISLRNRMHFLVCLAYTYMLGFIKCTALQLKKLLCNDSRKSIEQIATKM